MRRLLALCAVAFFSGCGSPQTGIPPEKDATGPETRSETGSVSVVPSFWMPRLGKHRDLVVYLPPDYEVSGLSYPVLYLQDGQNIFDPATAYAGNEWEVDESLDRLYAEYANDGMVVVGIYNGGADRWDEYSPWEITNLTSWCSYAGNDVEGGAGDLYAQDLVETVKPWVDTHYRTKPQREFSAIGGSSMGAFISLYVALKYQDRFSKIMAMSTAVWFDEASLLDYIDSTVLSEEMTIYLDVGTQESSDFSRPDFPAIYLDGTEGLYAAFIDKGVGEDRVRLVVDQDASHTESAWRSRFPAAIGWLFP